MSSLSVAVIFQFLADRGSSPQRSQDHIGAGTRVEQRPGVSINSPHHAGSCTPVQPRGFGQVIYVYVAQQCRQSATVHLSLTRANQVLEETVRVFSTSRLQTQQLDLHLEQVGHFDNKVIYASVKEESEGTEHLNHLSKSLRERCQTAGLTLIDGDRFTPHVTLLKLSKDPSLNRKVKKNKIAFGGIREFGKLSLIKFCFSSFFGFSQGIKAVASHLYEKHVDCVFGRQVTTKYSRSAKSADIPKVKFYFGGRWLRAFSCCR